MAHLIIPLHTGQTKVQMHKARHTYCLSSELLPLNPAFSGLKGNHLMKGEGVGLVPSSPLAAGP